MRTASLIFIPIITKLFPLYKDPVKSAATSIPLFSCTKILFFAILIIMELYYCNIAEFSDLCGSQYLPLERRQKMQRYRFLEDRARCLAAGLMFRYVFGESAGGALLSGPYGKPYLQGDSRSFNLSHAGSYVVLGVAACEIGIDIEKITPYSDAVAKKCFTAEEQAWLYHQGCKAAFYRLWTGKESIMKATGLGFQMPPESFHVLPVLDGEHFIAGKTWHLRWFTLKGHEICAATAKPEQIKQLIPLGRSELLGGE